jgi:3-isopropylmalate/(R)-2-methylmalate dehydratase small subunit
MEPLRNVRSIATPLNLPDVDTDQIFPARFIATPRGDGYGDMLFHDLRRTQDGNLSAEFVFNQPEYQGSRILVAGRNFACGSSREHAVWTLRDAGFRAVIAPSFSDIFAGNCVKNGVLAAAIPEQLIQTLFEQLGSEPRELAIDIEAQTITFPDGSKEIFPMDGFAKSCLINGFDEIAYTLTMVDQIEKFEAARAVRS